MFDSANALEILLEELGFYCGGANAKPESGRPNIELVCGNEGWETEFDHKSSILWILLRIADLDAETLPELTRSVYRAKTTSRFPSIC